MGPRASLLETRRTSACVIQALDTLGHPRCLAQPHSKRPYKRLQSLVGELEFLMIPLDGENSVFGAMGLQMLEGNSQCVEPTQETVCRDPRRRDQVGLDYIARIERCLRIPFQFAPHQRANSIAQRSGY